MMKLNNLHKNWRKAFILSACFVLALSILPSCKKTSSTLGTEALDVDALIAAGGVDNFQLLTSSVLLDTVRSDNQTFGTIGAYHDPKFGTVNASLYTRFSINGQLSLPAGATLTNIDSVVLSLNYGGYYGEFDPQTFEVYQLADIVQSDFAYRINSSIPTTGPNLVEPASATQKPSTVDSAFVGVGKRAPQLRLRLDTNFGTSFVNDIIAGNSAFSNSENFINSNYFKGLKINVANPSPAVGKGAVLYFKLGNADTKITIYFKLLGETTPREVSLVIDNKCADFNHVEVNNTGYPLANVLANPLNGQAEFYSQNFNAIPKIEFPSVSNLSAKTVINNALLYLPVAYQTGNIYSPNLTSLAVCYKDDEGKLRLITRTNSAGATSFVTGSYSNTQKGYVFDLREYIQDIVSLNKQNKGIYLLPNQLFYNCTADRIVFNGQSTAYKTKPKLVIKYTEFK
ncbi:DUF4270 family protein [Fluviicola taffensis]|uniref:DUF4270 domain-containing protein n=1 Tax=Fluviicola taffensis (strain DSM 16823 / NCIMB 13979 / RW262) TaxID=755732 RepID=F2IJK7_FLUTR|nr:DUF4270 family protein [Fluviicola taffensis]AEA42895.1 hypothetical protein Fluta_0894 [Fluviicola taffensis DSM 16823]